MNISNERFLVKINVNKEYLKENMDDFCNILHEHFTYHNKYMNLISSKKKVKGFYIILIFLFLIFAFILLISEIHFGVKILVGFIALLIVIWFCSLTSKVKQSITDYEVKLSNRKIELYFDSFPFQPYFSEHNNFKQCSFYNLSSNLGFILLDGYSYLMLFPLFALKIQGNFIELYAGELLADKITHKSNVLREDNIRHIKYKKFAYDKWLYQRNDGGPDRRYSHNYLMHYFECHWLNLLDVSFNIPDKQVYESYLAYLNFPISTIEFDGKLVGSRKIASFRKQGILYSNREAVTNFLKRKKVLFNDYGDSFEFEYKNNTYIVNNEGSVIDSDKNITEIFEE